MKFLTTIFLAIFLGQGALASSSNLTLDQAIRESLSGSLKLQKIESVKEQMGWKKFESYSAHLPRFNFSTQYLLDYRYMQTGTVPMTVPTTSMSLNALWPLFDGFASSSRTQAASSMEQASELQWSWGKFQLERETILNFYRALAAEGLSIVAEQKIKTLEDHLQDVQQFKKVGATTNYEVLKVEVQVSEAKSELMDTLDNVALAREKLAEAMGSPVENRALSGQLPVLSADLIKDLKEVDLNLRDDIKALQEQDHSRQQLASAANKFLVPKINLFGQYQYYNNKNDDMNDWDSYRNAHQIGVNLVWVR